MLNILRINIKMLFYVDYRALGNFKKYKFILQFTRGNYDD